MRRKIYLTLSIVIVSLLLSTFTFATENSAIAGGIRNVVGGAENVIQNTGDTIANTTRNVAPGVENMMTDAGQTIDNSMKSIGNGIQNAGNTITGAIDMSDGDYTAQRTANEGTGTFLGMDPTMFTWVIMAIVGLAIIALVWMYAKQNDHSYTE